MTRRAGGHITAASKGGKRYDSTLSPSERRSATNGIWVCSLCHALVDSDEDRYTAEILREWRQSAEQAALAELSAGISPAEIPGAKAGGVGGSVSWDPHSTWAPKAVRLGLSTGLLVRNDDGVAFSDRFLLTLRNHGRDWATKELDNFLRDGLVILLVVASARSTFDKDGIVPLREQDVTYLFSQVPFRAALHVFSLGQELNVFEFIGDAVGVARDLTEEFIDALTLNAEDIGDNKGIRPFIVHLLVQLVESRILLLDSKQLDWAHILSLFVFDRYASIGFIDKIESFWS